MVGRCTVNHMKVLVFLLLGLLLCVVTALLGTLFFYAGWNWGVVPATTVAREVTLSQAFWLSLCISAIGGMFKSSLTLNKDKE